MKDIKTSGTKFIDCTFVNARMNFFISTKTIEGLLTKFTNCDFTNAKYLHQNEIKYIKSLKGNILDKKKNIKNTKKCRKNNPPPPCKYGYYTKKNKHNIDCCYKSKKKVSKMDKLLHQFINDKGDIYIKFENNSSIENKPDAYYFNIVFQKKSGDSEPINIYTYHNQISYFVKEKNNYKHSWNGFYFYAGVEKPKYVHYNSERMMEMLNRHLNENTKFIGFSKKIGANMYENVELPWANYLVEKINKYSEKINGNIDKISYVLFSLMLERAGFLNNGYQDLFVNK